MTLGVSMKCSPYFLIGILPALLIIFIACEGTVSPIHDIVYHNSFENVSDLEGWEGISADDLVADTHPDGGNYAVRVYGGCILPTSKFTLAARDEDQYVTVTCLAKNMTYGGAVTLYAGENYSEELCVSIKDTVWTRCGCDKHMLWPANTTLSVCINSGGFSGGAVLVDELMIIKVD